MKNNKEVRNQMKKDSKKEKKVQSSIELKWVKEIIADIKDETILLKLVANGKDISRDFCWSEESAEEFIKSILTKIDVKVHLFFVDKGLTQEEIRDMNFDISEIEVPDKYEIETVDGKQRLKAMLDFYEDKIKVDGKYFSQHTKKLQDEFLNSVFMLITLPTRDNEKIKKMYADARAI